MTPMDHMSHDRSYDSVPSTSGAVGAGREGEWWGGKVSGACNRKYNSVIVVTHQLSY